MTGREKIEAAFSTEGTIRIPVVIPYEDIYIRDHWEQLTSAPWWHAFVPDIELQMAWRKEVIESTRYEWFTLPQLCSKAEREHVRLLERPDGVFQLDLKTGKEWRLEKPRVSGWSSASIESCHPKKLPATRDEIDSMLPPATPFDVQTFMDSGRCDLAKRMLIDFQDLFPICHVNSPLWSCYGIWGFEGMMEMILVDPELVSYACGRHLEYSLRGVREAAALGAMGIWIEECLTDMISPGAFESLSVPFVRRLVEEIRRLGMKSIHYFCGNPAGKLDLLLSVGSDALAFEEGKKGFDINIDEIADYVNSRCVLLGNLDAIGVLQDGSSDELRAEIRRQLLAAKINGGRFIMSLGSPVTPDTPVEKVRLYCDLVRETCDELYG